MIMILENAKKEIANNYDFESWNDMFEWCIENCEYHLIVKRMEQAAEYFADWKVNEQREIMAKHLNLRNVPKPKI